MLDAFGKSGMVKVRLSDGGKRGRFIIMIIGVSKKTGVQDALAFSQIQFQVSALIIH